MASIRASASITLSTIRDITAVYRFYKLQASTATAPTKQLMILPSSQGSPPTDSTGSSGEWTNTEPGYTEGDTSTLYTVELTYYTDGTAEFSEVSVSSSYEAAKQAWIKAQAAHDLADTKAQKVMLGTCSTAGATAAKVVVCEGFELYKGALIKVSFSTYNTVKGAITLNVNGTGAKTVSVNGGTTTSGRPLFWGISAEILFQYTGSYYRVIGEPRCWFGQCHADAATAKKPVSDASGVVVCNGTSICVSMDNENTATGPSLSVWAAETTPIYFSRTGSVRPTVANGLSWGAGTMQTFTYYNGAWYLGDAAAVEKALDASKVATNYLAQDNTGIMVYDGSATANQKPATASSRNVFIDSDSVDIRNGIEKLASFEEDAIHLGNNADSSQILMCKDYGRLGTRTQASDAEAYVMIEGEFFEFPYSQYFFGRTLVSASVYNSIDVDTELVFTESPLSTFIPEGYEDHFWSQVINYSNGEVKHVLSKIKSPGGVTENVVGPDGITRIGRRGIVVDYYESDELAVILGVSQKAQTENGHTAVILENSSHYLTGTETGRTYGAVRLGAGQNQLGGSFEIITSDRVASTEDFIPMDSKVSVKGYCAIRDTGEEAAAWKSENVLELGIEPYAVPPGCLAPSIYMCYFSDNIGRIELRSEQLTYTDAEGECYDVIAAETGTYNYWDYKKYSDGTFDLWGTYNGNLTHYSFDSKYYGYYVDWAFPPHVKPINTNYNVCHSWRIGSGHSMASTVLSVSVNGFRTFGLASGSGTQACHVDVHVHGRWK